MTFLSYSGRGGGGRGRPAGGRGRGRGGGYFPAGSSRGTNYQTYGRGGGKSSNTSWRRSSQSSSKWERPKDDDELMFDNIDGVETNIVSNNSQTPDTTRKGEQITLQQESSSTTFNRQTLKRMGKHKLVPRVSEGDSSGITSGVKKYSSSMSNNGWLENSENTPVVGDAQEKKESLSPQEPSSTSTSTKVSPTQACPMKKLGSNKLILSKKRKSDDDVYRKVESSTTQAEVGKDVPDSPKQEVSHQTVEKRTHGKAGPSGVWKKLGSNKLVIGQPKEDLSNTLFHGKAYRAANRNAPPSKAGIFRSTAKRIKVSSSIQPSKSSETDDSDHHKETTQEKLKLDEGTTTTSERLTDFAYRETSRVVPHAQHRSWKIGGDGLGTATAQSGPRNMGLVRVHPNQKKTPICPFFLKGVECTDTYCRKRHDIPKEFAMPVCSFFQRKGQCLKGDKCMFRHVKVNPRATICPSFAMLGFCDDKECAMKHVWDEHHPPSVGARKTYRNHSKIP